MGRRRQWAFHARERPSHSQSSTGSPPTRVAGRRRPSGGHGVRYPGRDHQTKSRLHRVKGASRMQASFPKASGVAWACRFACSSRASWAAGRPLSSSPPLRSSLQTQPPVSQTDGRPRYAPTPIPSTKRSPTVKMRLAVVGGPPCPVPRCGGRTTQGHSHSRGPGSCSSTARSCGARSSRLRRRRLIRGHVGWGTGSDICAGGS